MRIPILVGSAAVTQSTFLAKVSVDPHEHFLNDQTGPSVVNGVDIVDNGELFVNGANFNVEDSFDADAERVESRSDASFLQKHKSRKKKNSKSGSLSPEAAKNTVFVSLAASSREVQQIAVDKPHKAEMTPNGGVNIQLVPNSDNYTVSPAPYEADGHYVDGSGKTHYDPQRFTQAGVPLTDCEGHFWNERNLCVMEKRDGDFTEKCYLLHEWAIKNFPTKPAAKTCLVPALKKRFKKTREVCEDMDVCEPVTVADLVSSTSKNRACMSVSTFSGKCEVHEGQCLMKLSHDVLQTAAGEGPACDPPTHATATPCHPQACGLPVEAPSPYAVPVRIIATAQTVSKKIKTVQVEEEVYNSLTNAVSAVFTTTDAAGLLASYVLPTDVFPFSLSSHDDTPDYQLEEGTSPVPPPSDTPLPSEAVNVEDEPVVELEFVPEVTTTTAAPVAEEPTEAWIDAYGNFHPGTNALEQQQEEGGEPIVPETPDESLYVPPVEEDQEESAGGFVNPLDMLSMDNSDFLGYEGQGVYAQQEETEEQQMNDLNGGYTPDALVTNQQEQEQEVNYEAQPTTEEEVVDHSYQTYEEPLQEQQQEYYEQQEEPVYQEFDQQQEIFDEGVLPQEQQQEELVSYEQEPQIVEEEETQQQFLQSGDATVVDASLPAPSNEEVQSLLGSLNISFSSSASVIANRVGVVAKHIGGAFGLSKDEDTNAAAAAVLLQKQDVLMPEQEDASLPPSVAELEFHPSTEEKDFVTTQPSGPFRLETDDYTGIVTYQETETSKVYTLSPPPFSPDGTTTDRVTQEVKYDLNRFNTQGIPLSECEAEYANERNLCVNTNGICNLVFEWRVKHFPTKLDAAPCKPPTHRKRFLQTDRPCTAGAACQIVNMADLIDADSLNRPCIQNKFAAGDCGVVKGECLLKLLSASVQDKRGSGAECENPLRATMYHNRQKCHPAACGLPVAEDNADY